MKLTCLYILLFPLALQAQSIEENPAFTANSAAKISTIEKCEVFAVKNNGAGKEIKFLHRKYSYNAKGQLVSDIIYNIDNQRDSTYFLYAYNGRNLETKKYPQHVNMESDIVEAATEYYEYDTAQQLSKKTVITNLRDTTSYSYSYDENGRLNSIFSDSAIDKRYMYFYHPNRQINIVLGQTPIKNTAGWLLTDSFAYEYDSRNNLVKELHIKEDTERKRSIFEYNNQGKLSTKTVYVYGDTKPVYSTNYMYDLKSGLVQSTAVKTLPDKNKLEYKTTRYIYTYTYHK